MQKTILLYLTFIRISNFKCLEDKQIQNLTEITFNFNNIGGYYLTFVIVVSYHYHKRQDRFHSIQKDYLKQAQKRGKLRKKKIVNYHQIHKNLN